MESEPLISKTAGLGVSLGVDDEVLTMDVGELAHKDSEPIYFELPEESSEEKPFDDPNFRELPLASNIRTTVKNKPPSWTSELNLNYPTKDRVVAIALVTVVLVLLTFILL